MRESFFWPLVLAEYIAAFTVLAMILSISLGLDGFWAGFIGWAIVLALLVPELDQETRESLKRWALRRGGRAD